MPNQQLLSAGLEIALNKLLAFDPHSSEKLQLLIGKQCEITIQELAFPILFAFHANGVDVLCPPNSIAEQTLNQDQVSISLSLFVIKELQDTSKITQLIRQEKLDFDGNLQIAQGVASLFSKLNIDLEEILSTYLGDVPAHTLMHQGKTIIDKLKQQHGLLLNTLADGALEEKRIAVRPIIVENFVQEVKLLSQSTDRLAAKIDILEQKMAKKEAR